MVLFLEDSGGFRLSMTPQQHFNALNKEPTPFFPPHHITSTFFKSNGRLDSKMSMDHHWRKIGVFLSEF